MKDRFKKLVRMVRNSLNFQSEDSKYTYNNPIGSKVYNLLLDINEVIVKLHDDVQNNIFHDVDYYAIVDTVPLWIRNTGHCQESSESKELFEKLVNANDNSLTHKFLYYHDCEMLVNALQNRFTVLEELLNQVFKELTPDVDVTMPEYDDVLYTVNANTIHTHACINSIIINLASSCDIMTKIAFELSNMKNINYTKYPKMVSTNMLYGDSKRLTASLKQDDTYFANPRPVVITKVLTMRDEIIHNGSFDFYYSIYYGNKGKKLDKWVFCPMFDNSGQFLSFHGRKKFYSDANHTFNRCLPELMVEFLNIALSTVAMLHSNFAIPYYDNKNDITKFHDEIMNWPISFVEALTGKPYEGLLKERGK